jgi:enoyl-CoA hydratase/carnithine racemase
LRESATATLRDQLARESDAMLDCGRSDDAREGVEAFVARRAPRFQGR